MASRWCLQGKSWRSSRGLHGWPGEKDRNYCICAGCTLGRVFEYDMDTAKRQASRRSSVEKALIAMPEGGEALISPNMPPGLAGGPLPLPERCVEHCGPLRQRQQLR